jgi:hypothetical protein
MALLISANLETEQPESVTDLDYSRTGVSPSVKSQTAPLEICEKSYISAPNVRNIFSGEKQAASGKSREN